MRGSCNEGQSRCGAIAVRAVAVSGSRSVRQSRCQAVAVLGSCGACRLLHYYCSHFGVFCVLGVFCNFDFGILLRPNR